MKKKWLILGIVSWLFLAGVGCGKQDAGELLQSSVEERSEESTEVLQQVVSDTFATNEPVSNAENDCSNCIVQIQTDTRLGSGILWDKQQEVWSIVTVAHVVEGTELAEVYLVPEEQMCSAQVYTVKGLDLAFLQVDTALLEKEVVDGYVACVTSDRQVQSGERISNIGYNATGEMQSYEGMVQEPWIYVEAFDNYMLLCEGEAEAGMSGGGVFTETGALAGIVCGENEDGQLAVLPVIVIEGEYDLFINY